LLKLFYCDIKPPHLQLNAVAYVAYAQDNLINRKTMKVEATSFLEEAVGTAVWRVGRGWISSLKLFL